MNRQPARTTPDLRMPVPAGETALMARRRFFAMNADIQILSDEWVDAALLTRAEDVFHGVEDRFSRFRTESELSRLNDRTDTEVAVSAEMCDLLDLCRRFHRLSGGVFDPAVLPELEAAGYDRSFETLPKRLDQEPPPDVSRRAGSIADVSIDGRRLCLTAPAGLRLDLGGIGKGFAVDTATRVLQPAGDFLIDAGGDIYASGSGPDGDGWLLAVASPADEAVDLTTLRLHDEALATSTTARRRWERSGRWYHHLIDPRTGEPAQTEIVSASVVAGSAIEADVFAKIALILGTTDGERFLLAQGAEGLFVLTDGTWRTTENWRGGRG